MEQIVQASVITKGTVTAKTMLYKVTKIIVPLFDGDTGFLDIVFRV